MENQLEQNELIQKKSNGFGVTAMVLGIIAILGCWIPLLNFISIIFGIIALIFAIVGLIASKKGKKKGTSIAGLVLSIITILVFVSMYSATSKTAEKIKETVEKTVSTTQAATKKNDFDIKVLNSYVSKDYAEKPLLVVEYEFTNNTDKAKSFTFAVNDKAFQNGVECSDSTISDEIKAQDQLNEVKAGTPYKLKVGYLLQDTTTPVEIEVSDLFGDKPFFKQTVNLK